MHHSLRTWILAAQFAGLIALFSQFIIMIGVIPFTGQTLAVGLTATLLGRKTGTYAILLYMLLGLIGLPVFAGMQGGLASFFGPTGGYLIGFIGYTLITGWLVEKRPMSYGWAMFANLIGAFLSLVSGTLWLKMVSDLPWQLAFARGFYPFAVPEIFKACLAAILGILIYKRLATQLRAFTHR